MNAEHEKIALAKLEAEHLSAVEHNAALGDRLNQVEILLGDVSHKNTRFEMTQAEQQAMIRKEHESQQEQCAALLERVSSLEQLSGAPIINRVDSLEKLFNDSVDRQFHIVRQAEQSKILREHEAIFQRVDSLEKLFGETVGKCRYDQRLADQIRLRGEDMSSLVPHGDQHPGLQMRLKELEADRARIPVLRQSRSRSSERDLRRAVEERIDSVEKLLGDSSDATHARNMRMNLPEQASVEQRQHKANVQQPAFLQERWGHLDRLLLEAADKHARWS